MLLFYYIVTAILAKELVMATYQCQFQSPNYPGQSCEVIYNNDVESHQLSGYYWITEGPKKVYCGMTYSGSSCLNIYNAYPETANKPGYYRLNNNQWTYCNMTEIASGFISTCGGVGGGWRRIANIDVSAGGDCPSGWRKETHSGVSFCRIDSDAHVSTTPPTGVCSSAYFSTNGRSYQRVCGRARGYQKGMTLAFWGNRNAGETIDGAFADALSIYHDSPRQHIWSYVSGLYDTWPSNVRVRYYNCPCSHGQSPAGFVGFNYYCESGGHYPINDDYLFNDPLWDGASCTFGSCCANPKQPWFNRELSGPTASSIEARLCSIRGFNSRAVLIDQLELYIQ